MPGSGKSTLGNLLALELGYEYVDTDGLIEHSQGMTIEHIFSHHGENYFRQCEHEALQSTVGLKNTVISTGGGTPCFYNNMEIINANGISVYLEVSTPTLCDRLFSEHSHRPMLKGKSKEELYRFVEEKRKEREWFYKKAHYTVRGDDITVKNILTEIKDRLLM